MKKVIVIACLGLLIAGCNSGLSTTPTQTETATTMNVNLAWQATHGDQLGFYIEGSVDGTNFTQILTVPDGVYTASIPVAAGGTYYFRMRSFNSVGTSNYTPVVTVKL